MLILTRYLHHGDRSVICIGPDIEVTLVHVQGEQVHLAVDLPEAVPVSLHSHRLSQAPPDPVQSLARSASLHAGRKG